jgi:hypothetical protein
LRNFKAPNFGIAGRGGGLTNGAPQASVDASSLSEPLNAGDWVRGAGLSLGCLEAGADGSSTSEPPNTSNWTGGGLAYGAPQANVDASSLGGPHKGDWDGGHLF